MPKVDKQDLERYFLVKPGDHLLKIKPVPLVIFPEAEAAIKASPVPLPPVRVKLAR